MVSGFVARRHSEQSEESSHSSSKQWLRIKQIAAIDKSANYVTPARACAERSRRI